MLTLNPQPPVVHPAGGFPLSMDIPQLPSKELRFLQAAEPTTGRTVSGYALLFEARSANLGSTIAPWYEVIARNALPELSTQDVRALLDHESSKTLARSKYGSGTLKLSIDQKGLRYEFEAPESTAGNDLIEALKRG